MDLLNLIGLLKYIVGGIGVIGVVILIIGLNKGDRDFILRGFYILFSVGVLFICGYFISRTTQRRMNEMNMNSYFENFYEEEESYFEY